MTVFGGQMVRVHLRTDAGGGQNWDLSIVGSSEALSTPSIVFVPMEASDYAT